MELETWQRLKTFGKFGDSFDDILNFLMNATEEYQNTLNRFMQRQTQIEELNKKLGLTYENKERTQEQPPETHKQDYVLTEKIPSDFKSDALEVTDDKTHKKAKLK